MTFLSVEKEVSTGERKEQGEQVTSSNGCTGENKRHIKLFFIYFLSIACVNVFFGVNLCSGTINRISHRKNVKSKALKSLMYMRAGEAFRSFVSFGMLTVSSS